MGSGGVSLDQFLEEPVDRIASRYSMQTLAAVLIKAEEAIAKTLKEPVLDTTIKDLRPGALGWLDKYRTGGEANGSRFAKLEAGLVSWYHAYMIENLKTTSEEENLKTTSKKEYKRRLSKDHRAKLENISGARLNIKELDENQKNLLVAITAETQAALSEADFIKISKLDESPQLYCLGAMLRYHIQDDIEKHITKNKGNEKLSWLRRTEQNVAQTSQEQGESRDDGLHLHTASTASGAADGQTLEQRKRRRTDCGPQGSEGTQEQDESRDDGLHLHTASTASGAADGQTLEQRKRRRTDCGPQGRGGTQELAPGAPSRPLCVGNYDTHMPIAIASSNASDGTALEQQPLQVACDAMGGNGSIQEQAPADATRRTSVVFGFSQQRTRRDATPMQQGPHGYSDDDVLSNTTSESPYTRDHYVPFSHFERGEVNKLIDSLREWVQTSRRWKEEEGAAYTRCFDLHMPKTLGLDGYLAFRVGYEHSYYIYNQLDFRRRQMGTN